MMRLRPIRPRVGIDRQYRSISKETAKQSSNWTNVKPILGPAVICCIIGAIFINNNPIEMFSLNISDTEKDTTATATTATTTSSSNLTPPSPTEPLVHSTLSPNDVPTTHAVEASTEASIEVLFQNSLRTAKVEMSLAGNDYISRPHFESQIKAIVDNPKPKKYHVVYGEKGAGKSEIVCQVCCNRYRADYCYYETIDR